MTDSSPEFLLFKVFPADRKLAAESCFHCKLHTENNRNLHLLNLIDLPSVKMQMGRLELNEQTQTLDSRVYGLMHAIS